MKLFDWLERHGDLIVYLASLVLFLVLAIVVYMVET